MDYCGENSLPHRRELKPRDTVVLYGRQTKSGRHHTVYVHPKQSKFLAGYVDQLEDKSANAPLIQSQKNARRYNSNALCRLFGQLYRKANRRQSKLPKHSIGKKIIH
jgi:hypothetical protein